ncbi:MAG: hypothetical protein GX230_08085 [Lentisphaerae bacterium]|jgi:hypothetical protein|nr:hypothetical protein [Lentisphaerota bacterium]
MRPPAIYRHDGRRKGQAMIESVIVLITMCLVFFLFFQLCLGFATRDVLDHAAARAARARTVGFNRWMVNKSMRVAAIPVAGRMLEPADLPAGNDPILNHTLATMTPGEVWDMALHSAPVSPKIAVESARIPDYLAAIHHSEARGILDYDQWEEIVYHEGGAGTTIRVAVRKPLDMLVSVISGAAGILDGRRRVETLRLEGQAEIETHYSLYLEDLNY